MYELDKHGKPMIFWAGSFDDAYEKGYFWGNMSIFEFKERVEKYNPGIKIVGNKDYRALVDGNRFICGMARITTIPRVTIMKHDSKLDKTINWSNEHGEITRKETLNEDDDKDKVLTRGWEVMFRMLEDSGYKIDRKGL